MQHLSRITFAEANKTVNDEFKKAFANKYKNVCKEIEWKYGIVYIFINIYTPEYLEIIKELKEKSIEYNEMKIIEYSKDDLDNARYLELNPKYECLNPYESNFGKVFGEYRSGCKFYTNQLMDLEVRKKDIGKKEILRTYEAEEIIVSSRLKEILESYDLESINFRNVYTKGEKDPIAYQIVISNILSNLHPKTKLNIAIDAKQIGFTSYTMKTDELFYYPSSAFRSAKDFNLSSEYFGIGFYPIRLKIVSQNVRQIFLKEKIKGIEFTPIFIED